MNDKFYPMNSAEILDQVLDVYKRSFLKQIALSVIFYIMLFAVIYLLLFAGLIAGAAMAFAAFLPGAGSSISSGGIIFIAVLIILFLLALSMYMALRTTGNALITKQTFLDEHCDLGKVIKSALKKVWMATSAVIANAIVMIPGIIGLSAVVYVFVRVLIWFDDIGAGYWPFVITTILLILFVLGFFVVYTTLTMLSIPAAIFEGKWFFAALKRGFLLARFDFAKLMGIVTVWFLAVLALSSSVEIIFGLGSSLLMFFIPAETAMFMYLGMMGIRMLFTTAVSVVVAPLSGIFYTMIYINQRFKYEGLDVELNLNACKEIGR